MSQRVVLLNGPAGVGKTTVGRRLAATARNGVCIHADDLKAFVVTREPGTVAEGLSYVGGAALADVYVAAGYELVVFDFVFPAARHVERFRRALHSRVDVRLVTLWAPLSVLLARDGGADVEPSWARLEAHLAELGPVVDADAPVADVVDSVLAAIEDI